MSTQFAYLDHEKFKITWHDAKRLVSGVECKACGHKGVAQHMNLDEARSRGVEHPCLRGAK